MAPLIRTPTVDRNGKATTVYRRAEARSGKGSAALAAAAPVLAAASRPDRATTTAKVGTVPQESRAVRVADALGAFGTDQSEAAALESLARVTVELDDAEAYAYLRSGIPLKGAALLAHLGISAELAERTIVEHGLRRFDANSFDSTRRGHTIYRKNVRSAIDRMEEAGIPAGKAAKALANGLQDEHFGRALDVEQLVALFGRWNFKSSMGNTYTPGRVEQDDVLDSFVDGRFPFDLRGKAMGDLRAVEHDLRGIATSKAHGGESDRALHERYLADPRPFEALVRKLLDNPAFIGDFRYSPVSQLSRLVEEKGTGVLTLDRPGLAVTRTVEEARFIEDVFRLADAADPGATSWPFAHDARDIRGFYTGGLKDAVRNWDLVALKDAGFSPEEAHRALVVQQLGSEQAIAAHRDGIATPFADGTL